LLILAVNTTLTFHIKRLILLPLLREIFLVANYPSFLLGQYDNGIKSRSSFEQTAIHYKKCLIKFYHIFIYFSCGQLKAKTPLSESRGVFVFSVPVPRNENFYPHAHSTPVKLG